MWRTWSNQYKTRLPAKEQFLTPTPSPLLSKIKNIIVSLSWFYFFKVYLVLFGGKNKQKNLNVASFCCFRISKSLKPDCFWKCLKVVSSHGFSEGKNIYHAFFGTEVISGLQLALRDFPKSVVCVHPNCSVWKRIVITQKIRFSVTQKQIDLFTSEMQEQFWKYLNGIAMKYAAIEVEQLELKWKFLFLCQ